MNTWKVILATLVIFGAGVITGGVLVTFSQRALRPPHRPASSENARRAQGQAANARDGRVPAPLNGPLRRDFLNRLDRELKLTSRQRARIERIITEGQENTKELWQKIAPQVHTELATTRERIRAELTPEQRRRFGELLRQRPRNQRRPGPAAEHPATNKPARTAPGEGHEL